MRRQYWLVVFAGVIGLGFFGGEAQAQSQVKEQASAPVGNVAEYSLNFRFTVPAGWEIKQDVGQVRLMALAPQRPNEFRETINVSCASLPQGVTLDKYVSENKSQLQKQLRAMVVNEANFQLSAATGKKVVYLYTISGFDLQGVGYATVVDGRGFVLTATSTAANFSKFEAQFDAIAKSFAVK